MHLLSVFNLLIYSEYFLKITKWRLCSVGLTMWISFHLTSQNSPSFHVSMAVISVFMQEKMKEKLGEFKINSGIRGWTKYQSVFYPAHKLWSKATAKKICLTNLLSFPRTAILSQLSCLGQCNHLSSTFTNYNIEVISEIPLSFCCIPKSPHYLFKLFLSSVLSHHFHSHMSTPTWKLRQLQTWFPTLLQSLQH